MPCLILFFLYRNPSWCLLFSWDVTSMSSPTWSFYGVLCLELCIEIDQSLSKISLLLSVCSFDVVCWSFTCENRSPHILEEVRCKGWVDGSAAGIVPEKGSWILQINIFHLLFLLSLSVTLTLVVTYLLDLLLWLLEGLRILLVQLLCLDVLQKVLSWSILFHTLLAFLESSHS